MRKCLLLVLVMFSSFLYGQKDVTKFLGIPVDGSRSEMIRKLKAKGFKYDATFDWLEGQFNGREVSVHVVANRNKVWRVMVSDMYASSETDIRIRFNELLRQFSNNKKYMTLQGNEELSDAENISYGMSVLNKRYEAAFYQEPIDVNSISQKEMQSIPLPVGYTREQLLNDSLTEQELSDLGYAVMVYMTENYWSKKLVWFTIVENYGDFRIALYYDNEYNKANGEDL